MLLAAVAAAARAEGIEFVDEEDARRALTSSIISTVFGFTACRMIHLAKDWLLSFLPHALSKINRVHYGLVHDADIERWKAMEAAAQRAEAARAVHDAAVAAGEAMCGAAARTAALDRTRAPAARRSARLSP